MTITQLVKQLNSIKRKFGDIEVFFDAGTVGGDEELEIRDIEIGGVFKIRMEGEDRAYKSVVLGDANNLEDGGFGDQKNFLET